MNAKSQPVHGPASESFSDDELDFKGSAEPSVGVELELQILDRETGELAPGAVRILKLCEEQKVEGVDAELMQSMVEVKTGVCTNVGQAREQLLDSLRKVRIIAASLGYELALGGTHPFHRAAATVVYPDERYERVTERLAWITSHRIVFGLHVHVGVPGGDTALGVISLMVKYLPHLLALSANSPFWQGVDTGLASSRAALYGLLPHSGIPPHFGRWKDFCTYAQVMRDSKAISSLKDIYWDIRPRPDFGTLEFRICDTPPSLNLTLAIVALIRALVIESLKLLQERPSLRRGDLRRYWIASENKWLATRYGLDAVYIRTPSGARRLLRKDLGQVVDRLLPLSEANGDVGYLASLGSIEDFESGSDWLRSGFRETGDWKRLTDAMIDRLKKDLE